MEFSVHSALEEEDFAKKYIVIVIVIPVGYFLIWATLKIKCKWKKSKLIDC